MSGLPLTVPVVLTDSLYAPAGPSSRVDRLMEVALTYHNMGNYKASIETYMEAQKEWEEDTRALSLPPLAEMYFLLSIGSVLESEGQEGLALDKFMKAKQIALTLPKGNPDAAIPYNFIGCVYYHRGEYSIALDYFREATSIKASIVGVGEKHPDTALSYNNEAAALDCLQQYSEARSLYKTAYAILKANLGVNHPRTVALARNLQSVSHRLTREFTMPEITFKKMEFAPGVIELAVKAKGGKKKGKKGGKKKKK